MSCAALRPAIKVKVKLFLYLEVLSIIFPIAQPNKEALTTKDKKLLFQEQHYL